MPEEVIASSPKATASIFSGVQNITSPARQDFRFFNNDSGFVANLLHCNPRWVRPSNFLLPEILFYLIGRRKVRGDNGQMGFVSIARLLSDLEALGFVRSDIFDACHFGLSKELIEVETSSATTIRENRLSEGDCKRVGAYAHALFAHRVPSFYYANNSD